MVAVAVFSGGYLPGFKSGGPIASVSRIIESDPDHDFRVITRNHDEGDTTPYPGFQPRSWESVGRAKVAYLRPGMKDLGWIVNQLRGNKPDVYYLNSLHNPWFTLLPLLAIKIHVLPRRAVLLAPRGETSMGALGLKSKKKAGWRPVIKWLIGRKVTWHFSSALEENEARAWWGSDLPSGHRTIVQMDPAVEPQSSASAGPPPGIPVVTFASRIDPKKGLDEAIRLLAAVHAPLDFRVYGVVSDDEYWRRCQQLANESLPAGTLRYMGPYQPENSQAIFSESTVFLFPTRGENFGHVVAEALSVGCPVVITPTTPWTAAIEAGCGHVIRAPELAAAYVIEVLDDTEGFSVQRRTEVLTCYRVWSEHEKEPVSIFTL